MFRRNQTLGIALTALGVGILLAVIMGAGFFAALFGIILTAAGIIILTKRR